MDAPGAGPLLEFHDLTVAYAGRPVLWNVDFAIDEPCVWLPTFLRLQLFGLIRLWK